MIFEISYNKIIYIMVNIAFALNLKSMFITNTTPVIYTYLKSTKFNFEHVYPRCYMHKQHYNDMHNIFKSDIYINNVRSNYKYIDNSDKEFKLYNHNFKQLYTSDNYVNTKLCLFVPDNSSKGLIARAIMYMSYTYNYDYKKVIDSDNLINWCFKYPPTKLEYCHNNLIAHLQKNRNIFIDMYKHKKYDKLIMKNFT